MSTTPIYRLRTGSYINLPHLMRVGQCSITQGEDGTIRYAFALYLISQPDRPTLVILTEAELYSFYPEITRYTGDVDTRPDTLALMGRLRQELVDAWLQYPEGEASDE